MMRALSLGFAAICAFFSASAQAASCGFNSVSPVAFGTYNVFSNTPTDGVGSFTFQCSLLQALDSIVINLSTGSSGSYGSRTMKLGANSLNYNLFMDAARMTVWGDKTSGTSNYGPVILTILPTTLQIYGRIPALQNAKAGDYQDTVVITLLF